MHYKKENARSWDLIDLGWLSPAVSGCLGLCLSLSVPNSLLSLFGRSMSLGKGKVMAVWLPVLLYAFYPAFILVLALVVQAESEASAVTAPAEVRALNSIFHKWGISATPNQWNISGEPCSGAAIDSTSLDDVHYNPIIKCDCSYDSNATCHITQLKVYALNVVGIIPEELWTLTFLTNLNLGRNYLTSNLSSSIRHLTRLQYLNFGFNALSGEVPKELGELTNLRSLSFSSNNFSGSLPLELGNLVNLDQIDLSYNNLGGSFPFWVSQQNLQLNLDGNNFTTESSDCNTLPSGWNCLHRRFLCNRDSRQRFSLPTADNKRLSSNRKRTLPMFYVFGVAALFLLCASVISRLFKGRTQKEILDMPKLHQFSYKELKRATKDFDLANKLGEGGFGPVYKGELNGKAIAVKKRAVGSRQGSKEFKSEITTMSSVQHRNLVKLYGYCNERDEQILVFEFLENGSLDRALGGDKSLDLSWPERKEILLAVAKGLAYLHEDSGLGIIHRDVKASNILLDSNYIPKISDFGLAKPFDNTKTHISTKVAGTCGYLAPEYYRSGQLSKKADVYSFGVVVQEIVSGRKCCDPTLEESLPSWASRLCQNDSEVGLVDSTLLEFNEMEVKYVIAVSVVCTNEKPNARPSMSQVVEMLSHFPVVVVPSRTFHSTDSNYDDATSPMGPVAAERIGPKPPPGPSREQPATAEGMEIDQYDQSERVLKPPPGPSREQLATGNSFNW